jgi:hypothetical protein
MITPAKRAKTGRPQVGISGAPGRWLAARDSSPCRLANGVRKRATIGKDGGKAGVQRRKEKPGDYPMLSAIHGALVLVNATTKALVGPAILRYGQLAFNERLRSNEFSKLPLGDGTA